MIALARLSRTLPLVLALAACASGPALEVARTGDAPAAASAQTFVLSEAEEEVPAAAAVRRALEAQGWRPAPEGATWVVEAVHAARPETLGGYVEETAPEAAEAWKTPRERKRWWRSERRMESLTVRLLNAADRQEVARSDATLTTKASEPAGDNLTRLAEAAVAELVGAPGETSGVEDR